MMMKRARKGTAPHPFGITVLTLVFFISFLYLGIMPTTDVAASHEVIVTMVDISDNDRILQTDNQTEIFKLTIDYSDAASGDDIVNISLLVPTDWTIVQWSANGDNGVTNYWEDEDSNPSDTGNFIDVTDVQAGGLFNLTANGSSQVAPGETEDIEIQVITPPGSKSGISNWTLNLTDDDDDDSTVYLYIIAADADNINGYDIAVDVRDGREATFEEIIEVEDSILILPAANLSNNGLDTSFDEAPDYVNPTDVLVEDPDLVNGSGLIMWEDNEDTGGHFFSQVTGGLSREDVDDSQAPEDDYFLMVYPKNETGMSPMKANMNNDYNTIPNTINAVVVLCENLETFRDPGYNLPHDTFTTRDTGLNKVYMTLTGESRGGGADAARDEDIIEVGDYTDIVTGAESGVDLRDNGEDGIYIDDQDDPMDISTSSGNWASVPTNGTKLRVEADGNDDNQLAFRYIYVDNDLPSIESISITSNKTMYFFENDTDMLNDDDNVWFNSLPGEGGGQNITISVTILEWAPLNVSGTQAFGDTPMNESGTDQVWNLTYTIEPGATSITIQIKLFDMAGNNATYNITFQVDNLDPVPPSNVEARPDSATDVGEYDDDTTIFVTWQNGTDPDSGMKEHRMGNNSIWSDNTVHISGDNDTGVEGLETFYVFAVDNVGNVGSANDTITIDLTDPVISNISITSDSSWFYGADTDMSGNDDVIYLNSRSGEGSGQTITINVTWSDTNMNDTFGENSFGDSPTDTGSWWLLDYTIEDDAASVQNLTITVRDKAGRTATYVVDFIVDNTGPGTPSVDFEADPGMGFDDDGTLNASWNAVNDQGAGMSHYQVRMDSGNWANLDDTSLSWSGYAEGEHMVEVRAVDLVGNVGDVGNDTIIVDLTAPVITDVEVTSSKPSYFFEWDTDMDGSNDKVYFNSLDGEGANQVITMTITFNETNFDDLTAPGLDVEVTGGNTGILNLTVVAGTDTTSVTVTLEDKTLRKATYDIDLVQDNVDPTVNAGPDITLAVNEVHMFDASSASDDVGISGILWLFGDGAQDDNAVASHAYSTRGVYSLLVRATDLVGNVGSDMANVTVNTPPVLDFIEDQILYERTPFRLEVTASDQDLDILTFEDDTDLFDIDNSTGVIELTPGKEDVGSYIVRISVTDGIANDFQNVTFTVLPNNTAPVIKGIPDLIITRFDTDYFYDLLPYITDDQPIGEMVISVDSDHISVSDSYNTMLIMNYPRSMRGQREEVTVTVDDGTMTDDDVFTVSIGENFPPTLLKGLEDQTFPEDSQIIGAFSLDDHFKDDEDGSDLNYTFIGIENVTLEVGPDNMVNISAMENWFGKELVTIRAFDQGGAFVEDSFLVTVTPVNDPPVFETIPDLFVRYEEVYNLILSNYLTDVDDKLEALDIQVSSTYLSLLGDNSIVVLLYPESMNGSRDVVTISASDGEHKAEAVFNVTISDNYPPTLRQSLPDVTFEEDGTIIGAFDLNDYFMDPDGTSLTYQILWNHSVLVSISTGGCVDLSAEDDFFGVENLVFRAVDPRGAFVDDEVRVTVTPVNDPPAISPIPDQTGTVGKIWRLEIGSYLHDVDNDVNDLQVSTKNPRVTVVGTSLLFQYDKAQEDVVLITVSDGELEDTTSFIVRVKKEGGEEPPSPMNALEENCFLIIGLLIVLAVLIGYVFASSRRQKEVPVEKGRPVGAETEETKAEPKEAHIVTPSIVVTDGPEDIELGLNYLFEDEGPVKAFKTVERICDGTITGLAISSKHPKKLTKRYNLQFVKVFWLTDLHTDVPTMDPSRLDFEIMKKLTDFIKKEKEKAIILLDGIRQMIMTTSYDKIQEFLTSMAEVSSSNGSTLIVVINPNAYTKQERTQFEEIFDEARRFIKVEEGEGTADNGKNGAS